MEKPIKEKKELTLIEKARKARLDYQREYRAKHRERTREREIEYWARKYDMKEKGLKTD